MKEKIKTPGTRRNKTKFFLCCSEAQHFSLISDNLLTLIETSISSSIRSLMIILKSWFVSVVSSLNSFSRSSCDDWEEREWECLYWCLSEREVQDKLRPLLTPGYVRAVVAGGGDCTVHNTTTVHCWLFCQISVFLT